MDANEAAKVAQVNLMIEFLNTQRRALLMQVKACENMSNQLKATLPPDAQPRPGQDVVIYRDN